MLQAGERVIGTARSQAACDAFEAQAPGRAFGLVLDLADAEGVGPAVTAAMGRAGDVDILVNNAGYGLVGAIEEASADEVRAQFAVNLLAPVMLLKAVLPGMRARRAGRIVNVTSVSGLAAWSGTGVYCASKFALEAVGETLAQELAPFGIAVTNVAPGGMRTDYAGRSLSVTAASIPDYEASAHQSRRLLAEHAGAEAGDPDKVAAAILAVARLADPPLHLLLGEDALHYAEIKIARLQADIDRWRAVSMSTQHSS